MTRPTPIALCITDLDPGGAERALVNIVTRLDLAEWTPVVYCLGPRAALVDVLEQAGIETVCLGAGRRSVGVIWRLARELKRRPPALLQTFLFHANIAGRLAAKKERVLIVVSGIRVAEREKRWHLTLDRLTRGYVTHHVCVSRAVAEFAQRELHLAADRVSVIPNGVDAEVYANAKRIDLTQFGVPAGSRTLLFVGRLHPQKGVMILLDAFATLAKSNPEPHLMMVGEGPLHDAGREWARSHGVENRVHWLGRRNDVPSLMKSCDVLVLPSLWEGMPNVVLEAQAAGLSVVATAVDGTTELVTDGVTGTLVTPCSEEALATALNRVLNEPARVSAMATTAQIAVREGFTWDAAARSYDQLWRSLLAVERI